MQIRAVRLSLAVLFSLAMIAAAYQLFTTYRESRAVLGTHAAVDGDLQALVQSIADLRTTQQAYVAAGQGEGYWISRVSERLATLRASLTALTGRVRTPEARSELESAAAKLEDFEQMDRRVREYARGGQRLLASDLIFADGLETTQAAQTHVAKAQTNERTAAEATLQSADRRQAIILASAGATALFLVFLLVPPATIGREAAEESAAPSSTDILGLALNPAPKPEGAGAKPVDPLSVSSAADLCVELCRVYEPRQLPALLGRAAEVLDAGGIIVWMADPDRRELVPIVTHGYSNAALARFGTLPRDADNATAAAFREGALKTVPADGPASGAIVAPLVTPSGCVGVMTAEVGGARERDAATRALAQIIAAQLAALLGPAAATRAPQAAEA
jgi:GAF domain